jgi:diguanylate cyclase (GGDEF)-like protein/PAS domain S-box-containing protein
MHRIIQADPSALETHGAFDFSSGGSDMGTLLRSIDWGLTELGPIEQWPQSLRTAVSIMLDSKHPMFIAWGPSLICLFNDAYRPILGAKAANPIDAFGKPLYELWSDIVAEIKPLVDAALSGRATWAEDLFLITERNGFPEETYFTFSYSPIRGETGRVAGMFCACIETTAKVLANRQRAEAVETLEIATEAAQIGLFDYDLSAGKINCSVRTKQHFGLPPDAEVTEKIVLLHLHPDDHERVRKILAKAFEPGSEGRYDAEYRTIGHADGKERWITVKGQVYRDLTGKEQRLIGATQDVTERKLTEQRIHEASQHDSLTGLPNRALLFEYCTHLIAMSERGSTRGGAVLFIDLDRFKPINDLYGHDVGDKVLQEVARRLSACTRREDIVSRLGGDEFIVVLPHIDRTDAIATVARHILAQFSELFYIETLQLSVSPSIGISLFPTHSNDLEALIRYADLAMYSAKKAGRNNFTIYTPGHDERANDRLRLEIHLKHALEVGGMALHYQPIIDIATCHVSGVEALVRLPAENGALIGPSEFIPIAESAGLIDQLGEWVAIEACRQHQQWRATGMPPISIAINVSPIQFRQKTIAAQLSRALEKSGIDPTCLQIEVTESTVMDNVPQRIATLNEIKSMGVRISLDDFGTGYSSLSYLSNLPLDKLKIDQSFIRKLNGNQPNRSITEAIIALGKSLNLKVVGEGIESEDTMDYLRRHGCDQAQGFLFSKPLPASDFENWYRKHTEQYH